VVVFEVLTSSGEVCRGGSGTRRAFLVPAVSRSKNRRVRFIATMLFRAAIGAHRLVCDRVAA
jgi:hypothetical protein